MRKVKIRLPFHFFILASLLFTTAMTSCKREHEEVVAFWDDGSPQLVVRTCGKGDSQVKTAEIRYYRNGNKHYEKYYDNKHSQPTGQWCYYYEDGKIFATATFDRRHRMGYQWKFLNEMGTSYVETETDSIVVMELSEYETPASVCFYHDSTQLFCQFYSNYMLRSQGTIVNGKRDGEWKFFFSNGMTQTEATFVNGKEEGTYTVYRENGIPFYRGQYHEGRRVGTWELYDENANLTSTQDYE